eukprot:1159145-Pelagomonas_calceolata.AAC.25
MALPRTADRRAAACRQYGEGRCYINVGFQGSIPQRSNADATQQHASGKRRYQCNSSKGEGPCAEARTSVWLKRQRMPKGMHESTQTLDGERLKLKTGECDGLTFADTDKQLVAARVVSVAMHRLSCHQPGSCKISLLVHKRETH